MQFLRLYPELRKIKSILTKNERQEIYKKLVQKAKEILPDIDAKELYNKLNDSGHIIIGNLDRIKNYQTLNAVYKAEYNYIFIYSKTNERIIFHEAMHKLQRKINKKLFDKKYPSGINEGAVEYTTERAYEDGSSSYRSIGHYDVKMNFSVNTTYEIEVAMINQINQILGNDKVIKSVLNGDIQWAEDFIEEYGEERFNAISKLVNQLHKKSSTQKDTKTIEQILKCQEILLTCYDEKFKNCITEQDYINYLQDLQKFQTCQIGIEDDKTYEYYQKTMFEKIKEIFISKGYSINKLNNYIYTEPKYKPTMTVAKQLKGNEIDMLGIARDCVDTNQNHELSEYTRKMDPNNLGYDLIQRNGKLISCRTWWREKAWQICEKPIVITDEAERRKFNLSDNQTLYRIIKINEKIYIVENSDGSVILYNFEEEPIKKVDGFEQIDIGIPEEFFNKKIKRYIELEKEYRKEQEKNKKKRLKDKKNIEMLPEGNPEKQIDESKKFRESMKKDKFISQETQGNYDYGTTTDQTTVIDNTTLEKAEGKGRE